VRNFSGTRTPSGLWVPLPIIGGSWRRLAEEKIFLANNKTEEKSPAPPMYLSTNLKNIVRKNPIDT